MALTTNEYVKYDTTEHFYYLTEAGLINYTGLETPINMWKPSAEFVLKNMGRALHSLYTDSLHNMKPKYFKHRELIEYKIFTNAYGERQAIINALTYMIYGQEDNDWFTHYLAGEAEWSKPIKNMLKSANVLVLGQMSGSVPEDEYQVGY